uniref:Uncharacterized protein n=1 Tax=Yersinia enterocolitica W22703 TaxID=913028 RepID=F4MZF8_YEREN|nr:unknown protein [Yersinia enterocolitica W22703]
MAVYSYFPTQLGSFFSFHAGNSRRHGSFARIFLWRFTFAFYRF